jgi:hypothetical protein
MPLLAQIVILFRRKWFDTDEIEVTAYNVPQRREPIKLDTF